MAAPSLPLLTVAIPVQLTLRNESLAPGQKVQNSTAQDAKKIALEFIQNQNLNAGAAAVDETVNDNGSASAVEVKLANGKTNYVSISKYNNRVIFWSSDVPIALMP